MSDEQEKAMYVDGWCVRTQHRYAKASVTGDWMDGGYWEFFDEEGEIPGRILAHNFFMAYCNYRANHGWVEIETPDKGTRRFVRGAEQQVVLLRTIQDDQERRASSHSGDAAPG